MGKLQRPTLHAVLQQGRRRLRTSLAYTTSSSSSQVAAAAKSPKGSSAAARSRGSGWRPRRAGYGSVTRRFPRAEAVKPTRLTAPSPPSHPEGDLAT